MKESIVNRYLMLVFHGYVSIPMFFAILFISNLILVAFACIDARSPRAVYLDRFEPFVLMSWVVSGLIASVFFLNMRRKGLQIEDRIRYAKNTSLLLALVSFGVVLVLSYGVFIVAPTLSDVSRGLIVAIPPPSF